MNINKILLIARREFIHNVRRPAFLFAVFGTPLIVAISLVLSIGLTSNENDISAFTPVGVVDASDAQILAARLTLEDNPDTFVYLDDRTTADQGMENGTIKSFIEVTPLYMQTGRINLYTRLNAPDALYDAVDSLMLAHLTAGVTNPTALSLVRQAPDFNVTVLDGNRTFSRDSIFFVSFLPIIFGFFLVLSSVTTSSFLMSGLVEEKTNRIMEILVTSVKPMELLVGKLIGMCVLGLLQVVTLLVAAYVGISIANQQNILSGFELPPDLAVLALVYYFLSYVLLAAISICIGAIVGSEQESRQLSAIIILPVMIPYLAFFTFLMDPNGALPVALSLIPVTAPMAVLMRVGITTVPLWQILVSIAGLIVVNAFVLWLSARMFRWGVLSTNKMPNLRRIVQIILGRAPAPAPSQPKAEVA
ncbi:MAG: ABC transporter permease [Chloroflexi bacterium]|nr:ABC transporter permease [Chloroflexota bacterium]